ncbi:ABC transporter ATP-binding subunit [Desulfuromonas versatilis]|uniref:ABC transporter ATP-binding subunit n=1 Tax=Desulfuromonas versatilis TaxID=2802975 RepID=A0ABM8HQW2_9BACT|nr:ABC transporter ATP-binding protein [Desulfuromonas versatilis]BCR02965.1 ABC transporter ATP-binding subunit [Desulfuromonas versatilis]
MTNALQITDLWKSFAGTAVVKGVEFAIAPGEIFGLLGPNGAGKSTTINMVAGVARIDRGSVKVFGYDNQREYRRTRRLVGVMHQEIVIDHFFPIDRALRIHSGYYGAPADAAWRERLIERLDLGPHLHKPMNKLSGGLKRRFMVAKALIHKPRLLILDEPTAGVDVELRHGLWDFVREINHEGTTVLLTTHYLEEAEQMCGRIAIMNHGELIALERTPELLRRLENRCLVLTLSRPLGQVPAELAAFGATLEAGGETLTLAIPPGKTAGDALGALTRVGVEIAEIETRKAGLEEVFIELTGMRVKNGRGGER